MHRRFVCNILLLLYWFFDYIKNDEGIPTCIGEYKNCCSGYFWNSEINLCENCVPGYIGINCSSKCPFPTYGINCQGICNCSDETCDISTGCNTVLSGTTPAQKFNPLNKSVTLFKKKIISSNIVECVHGYIGINCLSKCPFPTYGINCQEICNSSDETCDISTGCNTVLAGTTPAKEFNTLNTSVTLFNKKTISSNIAPNLLENNDRIFIFLSTFACIGIVLLTAHLIVYIIYRRRQAVSMTITSRNHQGQGVMYDNIRNVSSPIIY